MIQDIWLECMRALGLSANEMILEQLRARWSEDQRSYHNLDHLDDCLCVFGTLRDELHDPVAVALALFYHDVIYDPRSATNEEDSEELWRRHAIILGVEPEYIERVASMILATKTHQADDEDTRFMLDIDLSILGVSEPLFDRFEQRIRQEYAWVPEQVYRERRAQIMRGFLDREHVYATQYMRDHFERRARKNLTRLIETLEAA